MTTIPEEKTITLWTAQSPAVAALLSSGETYLVKRRYVDQKYQAAAWSFREAYAFFTRTAVRYVPKPEGAESGIWLYRNRRWACSAGSGVLIRAEIPLDRAICFDLRVWNRILNLEFIGSSPEETAGFQRELRKLGLENTIPLFRTPYYPVQRRRVQASWDNLYRTGACQEAYLQAAVWELRPEWICGIFPDDPSDWAGNNGTSPGVQPGQADPPDVS